MSKQAVPKLKESSNCENIEVDSNPVNGMRKTTDVDHLCAKTDISSLASSSPFRDFANITAILLPEISALIPSSSSFEQKE